MRYQKTLELRLSMNIIVTLFVLFFSMSVSAKPLNNLVVFGDSLSDSGNLYEYMNHQLPVSPPYYHGRFTNGPVWIELLAEKYYGQAASEHLHNYAYGGAGVMDEADEEDGGVLFTFKRELDNYFLTHQDKANAETLYVVWIGSNNYLAFPDDEEKMLNTVTTGIKTGLQRLVDHGAKNLLIVNLPDMGLTPASRDSGDSPEELSRLTKRHNQMFHDDILAFEEKYPEIHWVYLDVNQIFSEILTAPAQFGFTNTTDTCYEAMMPEASSQNAVLNMVATVIPGARKADACTGYLFFDPVHPSALAHQIMAEKSEELIAQAGIQFE